MVFRSGIIGRPDVVGEGLHGGGRQYLRQFRQMGTAGGAGQTLFEFVPEALHQIQAHQLILVGGRDGIAMTGIRHGIGRGFGIDDGELAIYGQAEMKVMQRRPGSAWARSQHGVDLFDIGDVRVKIP